MKTADDLTIADPSGGTAAPRSMRWLGSIAVVFAMLSATVTFAVLVGLTPIAPTHQVVLTLFAVDAFASLLLIAVIGRSVWITISALLSGSWRPAAVAVRQSSACPSRSR